MSAYTQSYFYRKVYFSNSSVTTTPSSGVAVPGADVTLTFFFYLVTLSEDCQENCVTMLHSGEWLLFSVRQALKAHKSCKFCRSEQWRRHAQSSNHYIRLTSDLRRRTRAIHIECSSSRTTQSLSWCRRRFAACSVIPELKCIRSDNAFKAATSRPSRPTRIFTDPVRSRLFFWNPVEVLFWVVSKGIWISLKLFQNRRMIF